MFIQMQYVFLWIGPERQLKQDFNATGPPALPVKTHSKKFTVENEGGRGQKFYAGFDILFRALTVWKDGLANNPV